MQNRYGALTVISGIQKIAGWLIIGIGFFIGIIALFSKEPIGFLIIIGAGICGIFLIAFSEFIHLMIDIEDNTRRASSRYNSQIENHQSPSPVRSFPKPAERVHPQDNPTASAPDRTPSIKAENPPKIKNSALEDFERKSLGAKFKISQRGYTIETIGEYPDIEWTIKQGPRSVKKTRSIDELVEFAEKLN